MATIVILSLVVAGSRGSPPASGDWYIDGNLSYSDTELVIPGDIYVMNGSSLALSNVTLSFDALGLAILHVESEGSLSIDGGRIESGSGNYNGMRLYGRCDINGTTIENSIGVDVLTWNASIANCTIMQPKGHGIYALPMDLPGNTLTFRDNIIAGSTTTTRGIHIEIDVVSEEEAGVLVVGNTVFGTSGHGIDVTASAPKGAFMIERNNVMYVRGHGMALDLSVDNLELGLDANHVNGSLLDGLHLVVSTRDLVSDEWSWVVSESNQRHGVYVASVGSTWEEPRLRAWRISDNGVSGVYMENLICATMEQSLLDNPDAAWGDLVVRNATLDIFSTTHPKASAQVLGGGSLVTSYRFVNVSLAWQNMAPCREAVVEVRADGTEPVWSGRTDGNGWLGNITMWDWRMSPTQTWVRNDLVFVMPGPSQGSLETTVTIDRDVDGDLVITDGLTPVIEVQFPSHGHLFNASGFSIHGTATDDHSGLYLVECSVDSEHEWGDKDVFYRIGFPTEPSPGTGPWGTAVGPLHGWPNGTLTMFVRAFDYANYPDGPFSSVEVRDVTFDLTPPTITVTEPVTSPPGYALTNQTPVLIRGHVDADTVSVKVDGRPASLDGSVFQVAQGLVEGENLVTLIAEDLAGNVGKGVLRVTLDTVPPSLSVTTPEDGWVTSEGRIEVSGTTDVDGTTVFVDGERASQAMGSWHILVDLSRGPNRLRVVAQDEAGNGATIVITVFHDDVAPELKVVEPTDGGYINSSSLAVTGLVDPDLLIVNINGVPVSVVDGEFSLVIDSLPDGPMAIVVLAEDLVGNVATVSMNVTIDTGAPWLRIVSPQDGHITNVSTLEVVGEVEAGASISVNGHVLQVRDGSFSTTIRMDEGWNGIQVDAWDPAMNHERATRRVLLDTIPPTIHLEDVDGNRVLADADHLTVEGTTEAGATLSLVMADGEHGVEVGPDGRFVHTFLLNAGVEELRLTAVDRAGNVFSMKVAIVRATTEPSVSWPDPPVLWTIVAVTVLVVAGAAVTSEGAKFALVSLSLPLYSKLKREEVLDNKTRYALHGYIVENPGMYYKALKREFGLTNGVAVYHLNVLEREGFVRSVRDGRLKRYYSKNAKVPRDHRPTSDQLRSSILELVAGDPGICQTDIVDELGIPRETVGYHLRELVGEKRLEVSRKGRYTVYNLKGKR